MKYLNNYQIGKLDQIKIFVHVHSKTQTFNAMDNLNFYLTNANDETD